jgi:hypothetical protein
MDGEAKNGELNDADSSETPPVEADDLPFEKAIEQEETPGL